MAGYNDSEGPYTQGSSGASTHLTHITDITNKFDKDITPNTGDVPMWNGTVYAPHAYLPDEDEKVVYVTPRGNDSNDGLTLKTAKLTIAAGLTALGGGGTIQLGVGSFSTSATHGLSDGTKIIGAGPGLTTITYTGSGSLFVNATPGTRIYNVRLIELALTGPGSGTTAVGVDLKDISLAIVDGVNLLTFGTGIKHWSAVLGGSVYNDFSRCSVNSCGIGVDFQATGSNGSRWRGVKFTACTTGVKIVDSNQNNFDECQFESCTTAVYIDSTVAGTSDHNSFTFCRWEGNTTDWNIVSANVRDTEIIWPAFFGSLGIQTDNGTRPVMVASHGSLAPVGTRRRVTTRTGNTTIDDGYDVVLMNATSLTATLPSAVTAPVGRQYKIKNLHSTGLTVNATAGNIDGVTTNHLAQYQTATYVSDGANWWRVTVPPATPVDVDWTRPTAALVQTFGRTVSTINSAVLASGSLWLVSIYLPAGTLVSTITFTSATTALATGSNQWFALYSSARALLGVTNDDTSTAWAAEATKTLTLASPFTVLTSGMYYLGINVVATTVPSLRCSVTSARISTQVPILAGTSTTGLTNPASAPGTAAAITASGSVPYAFVS